ncbi:MAG: heparan-alpha-glucosaminide N-acetyltransferase domain-containing protein [Bacteroidota bacterium]
MAQQKQRYIYIDLLRGWAVLVMIEVHVFNAFLLPELREESWFTVLNFINGLVAPSFLFASGYSFVIVAQRKWNDYLNLTPVFWKQLGRIAQIWAVGYALHLPFFSFNKLTSISWEEWSVFWKVDVLHTIAVSLLTMVVLVMLMREQKKYFLAVLVLACIFIFGSPVMYDRNLDHLLPEPIANYFTAAHRSQFPLFPWMGFVLAGGITAQLWVWWKVRIEERKIFIRFFVAAVVMIVASLIFDVLPFSLYPEHNYWKANPGFFFLRLGMVVILLAMLWYWEKVYQSGKSIVSVVGSESLVAYAGHLLVIYGQFFNNHSLSFVIGKTRTVPEVAVMTAGLVAATVLASYLWHSIKNWSMFYARVLMYSILLVVLFIFFTKPQ